MSYAASLLAAYPSSYGPSTLLSDELVAGPSRGPFYGPSASYGNGSRLLSDDLAFNPVGLRATSFRPGPYSLSNSMFKPTSQFDYRMPPMTQWPSDRLPQNSFGSLNDISEYSESLATASNTNTASSVARSMTDNPIGGGGGPSHLFTNYQPSYGRMLPDSDDSPRFTSLWSPTPVKKPIQTTEEKPLPTQRSVPPAIAPRTQPPSTAVVARRTSPVNEDNKEPKDTKRDLTPVPHLERNATIVENPKPQSSVDIEAWLSESKKDSPIDEKKAEQTWSVKVDQLHTVQRQREKDKIKSSRALPVDLSKKPDNKPPGNKPAGNNDSKGHDPNHTTAFQMRHDTYFDSLFDGVFFRKSSNVNNSNSLSYQNPKPIRSKPTATSFNKPTPIINQAKNAKFVPTRKTQRYEPPSSKRVAQAITTTSWRKQWPKRHYYDSVLPYYLHNELTHRDFVHKDTDERFREALQALRQDKAEQQQKEATTGDGTAKRLNYGDYVRHSTKDALLHNAVKPSPWSDFMDLKKGNLYSLTQEEKKELYYQSKSYGERVRHRNLAMHLGDETNRSYQRSLIHEIDQEPQSGNVTPRAPLPTGDVSKSVSRTSRRLGSASTTKTTSKTFTKSIPFGAGQKSHQSSRTTLHTDRSSTLRPSEEEDEDVSDFEGGRKQKKQQRQQTNKNVSYAKYDSSGRNTSVTEVTDNEGDGGTLRNRDTDDDLFTVREEKTLESLEGSRYKKR